MSTAVSSATASAASSAASSSATCVSSTEFLLKKDAACAVQGTAGAAVPDNYHDILSKCCGDAPVEEENNGCALWCLATDQSVDDLQKCLQKGGANAGGIQCNKNGNATATEKPSKTGSSTKETGSGSESGSASGDDKDGAAVPLGVSKAGVVMLAMVLGSAVFGAML